jgi:hypothetical protein
MCGARRDGTIQTNSLRSKYCFRDLSPEIGTKQNVLTVNVTVKFEFAQREFSILQAIASAGNY